MRYLLIRWLFLGAQVLTAGSRALQQLGLRLLAGDEEWRATRDELNRRALTQLN
jgi:hypothetical protein